MTFFLPIAQAPTPPQIRDIAPPIDILPYPPWMIYTAAAIGIMLVGVAVWFAVHFWRNRPEAPTPREIARAELEKARGQIKSIEPYAFSILVSDILRSYISSQYQLRATQQTSPEFLASISDFAGFSATEKSQLAEFLDKCDLIKFAHVSTTTEESSTLLEQAIRFVEGGTQ
ncbi:MAG: DUF4381 family protein [Chthoniobacteraceae bacterium]